jgi:hypothetical protein
VAVPMVRPPSAKVTVPVAVEGEVVAVRVMLFPETGAVFDAVNVIAVERNEAVTDRPAEVLAAYPALPV